MAKTIFGSGVQPKASPNANGAYFRLRDLGIIDAFYLAQEGDYITDMYWQRGGSSTVTAGTRLVIYEAPAADKEQATLYAERPFSVSSGTAYIQFEELVLEKIPLRAGYHYLVGFRGLPGEYAARSDVRLNSTRKVDLGANAAETPASLNGITWTAGPSTGSILGVKIANANAKTTVTFGEPATENQHIAKYHPAFRVNGAQCRYSDFSDEFGPVTVDPDGTFSITEAGVHHIDVEFSSDGSAWDGPYQIVANDLTALPAAVLGGAIPKPYNRCQGTTTLGFRSKVQLLTDGAAIEFEADGTTVNFGSTQGRVAFQDGATEPEKTLSTDLVITSWSPTIIAATMVGTENVVGARYFRVYDSADAYIGQVLVKS